MRQLVSFVKYSIRAVLSGGPEYKQWVIALLIAIGLGGAAYSWQISHGLAVTNMTDEVSWGAYIANFTFCVGLAAAAVMVVIPAYVYKNKPIKEVVFVGELLAIAAVVVCLLFVTVDLGRPDRFWHLIPLLGKLHFPGSVLAWDVVVLNGYLAINIGVAGYLLYCKYIGVHANTKRYVPVVFVSMAWAVSLHTVTAFLYVGLGGRAYWNSAILAPRFLASAFVAGPAFIILSLRGIREYMGFAVKEEAIISLRRILSVTTLINLFLFGSEVFKEFYSGALHSASARYLLFGLEHHHLLVPYAWTAIALNVSACLILLVGSWSARPRILALACVMAIVGVWIEKGMGLLVPGFVPTQLGQIHEYSPSLYEFLISVGVWSVGALVFTLLLKIAVPIEAGLVRIDAQAGSAR